jgi:shikimate 5-dehydrogenase
MTERPKMAVADAVGVGFLGVTTRFSAVHRVFDLWSDCLGQRLILRPRDLPLKSNPAEYCRFIADIRQGKENLRGAVITSHKVGVYEAAAHLLDIVTPTASRLGEIGLVYWRQGRLVGDASDSFAILKVARRLLSVDSWQSGERSALVLGGGGAGTALADSLIQAGDLGCRSVTITETDAARVSTLRSRIMTWSAPIPIRVQRVEDHSDNLLAGAGEGTLIVNASGLGKDQAGSPISQGAVFPRGSFAWEFNYRFIAQSQPTFWDIALRQKESRKLTLEDGWDYFVWNWLGMLSTILDAPPDEFYDCFRRAANALRYVAVR